MIHRTTKADIEAILETINSIIPKRNRIVLESRDGVNVVVLYKGGLPERVMMSSGATGQTYTFLAGFLEGMCVML